MAAGSGSSPQYTRRPRASGGPDFRFILKAPCIWLSALKTLIALACCLFVWSQAAFGHAVLVASSPAAGAVLAQVPQDIILKFDEPVRVTSVRLLDPQGHPIVVSPQPDGVDGVRLALPPGPASAGTYLLGWRVLSQDGHPVGGRLDYSIGTMSTPATGALAQTAVARSVAIWLTHWLLALCVFAVGGAALFRLRFQKSRQGWARPLVVVGLVLLLADLALQGMDLLDVPWTSLWTAAPWKVALSGVGVWVFGLMALGLLVGWVALAATRTIWLWALASAVLPSVALAMGAQLAPSHAWLRPLLAVHVLAAMAWLGALVPWYRWLHPLGQPSAARLSRSAGSEPDTSSAALGRWGVGAALLVVTGLPVAILQLGHWRDLWQTDFGSVLVVVGVVGLALLFVAGRNRMRMAAAGRQPSVSTQSRIRRGLGTEIILAVGLLGIVALWRFAPPSQESVAARLPQGPVITLEDRTTRALVELPLLNAGAWRIQLISIDGAPLNPQRVVLTLKNPEAGVAPMQYQALRQPDGRWRVDVAALTAPGPWQVVIDVWVGEFRQVVLQQDVVLPRPAASAPAAGPAHQRQ